MQSSLDPVRLTDRIKNEIVGMLLKSGEFQEFQSMDKEAIIMLHHTLGQDIRNRWIWKNYDADILMHPDDLSYEWMVAVWEWVNENDFDLQEFINQNPEALI